MTDKSRSRSKELFHVVGFGSICKACKSFVLRCYPGNLSKKKGNKTKPRSSDQHAKVKSKNNSIYRNSDKDNTHEIHEPPYNRPLHSRSCDDRYLMRSSQCPLDSSSLKGIPSHGQSPLARSSTRRRQTMTPTATAQRNSADAALTTSLSSRIVYSNLHGLMKPHVMERQLNCTIDELCFGCIKKINIARVAVMNNGQIIEEDEELTIKVKPGWRKGTMITFEGRNEKPGVTTADVVFIITETEHPLFIRREDDLELQIEIPLIDALTGCTLSVPLLGKQEMSLTIDEIVHPGYEKIIEGEGMPKLNEPGTRGDLVITFLVKFPEELTAQQRSDAANILQQTC